MKIALQQTAVCVDRFISLRLAIYSMKGQIIMRSPSRLELIQRALRTDPLQRLFKAVASCTHTLSHSLSLSPPLSSFLPFPHSMLLNPSLFLSPSLSLFYRLSLPLSASSLSFSPLSLALPLFFQRFFSSPLTCLCLSIWLPFCISLCLSISQLTK